jgi:hypothetical protein
MKHNNSQPDDKITFKKVLDLVNKTDEHGLREMNKKLQNMLEETLTKNMHLQKVLYFIFTVSFFNLNLFKISIKITFHNSCNDSEIC